MKCKLGCAIVLSMLAGFACAQSHSGIAVADVDTSVRPGENFFKHVNGNWYKRNPMPDNKSRWGPTALVAADMRERLQSLIKTASSDNSSADARMIAAFFDSAMDEKQIESLGISPLRPELDSIVAIRDKSDLAAYLAHLGAIGATNPLELSVHLDARNARRFIADLGQGELALPEQSYYLEQNAEMAAVRSAYVKFLTTVLTLSGDAQAGAHTSDVLALESALAAAQASVSDSRDALKTSNTIQVAQLNAFAPGFDWPAYLKAARVPPNQGDIVVSHPEYLKQFARLSAQTSLATWKNYLVCQLLGSYAGTLSSQFSDASYAFFGVVVDGKKAQSPRWQRAVAWTEGALGDSLGRLYVQRYFPNRHLERATEMVESIKSEFRASIEQISWMSPSTRKEALAKLATMSVKVGYPKTWRDYSGLLVKRDDLVGNLIRSRLFERQHQLDFLNGPVVRTDWNETPQTVSANYDHSLNAITIPAGRLQPPYFDADADDAVNYGAIASVIGHEISHAFDNEGANFDSDGQLRDWWSAADRANFTARAQRMIEQYGQYSPLPGQRVNGQLTLGENIADNLGLAIALRAYHRSLGGKPGPVLDGYSADQRFFMGYARSRSNILRDALMIATLKRDEHSPDEVRVNGAVRNQDAFHVAFGIKPGDPMYLAPADRVSIW